jgi:hypothetical protein
MTRPSVRFPPRRTSPCEEASGVVGSDGSDDNVSVMSWGHKAKDHQHAFLLMAVQHVAEAPAAKCDHSGAAKTDAN